MLSEKMRLIAAYGVRNVCWKVSLRYFYHSLSQKLTGYGIVGH
jgi:hypothetical protein